MVESAENWYLFGNDFAGAAHFGRKVPQFRKPVAHGQHRLGAVDSVGRFAPQISVWNDSDGVPLDLDNAYRQECRTPFLSRSRPA
jgi:hypothetical protein